jgi:signal transduction histidine kinase
MMQVGTLSSRKAPYNPWFLVLTALVVIPFVLSAGYSLTQLSQGKQDIASEQLVVKANKTALVVKERVATSVAALNAIASSDAALRADLPALYQHAQRVMQRMPENNSISLASSDGIVLFTTLQPFGSPSFPSLAPEVWKRVFDAATPALSEPFVNPINQRSTITIGVPIFQRGKVAYCLSMVVLTNAINDLLMAQEFPEEWSTIIISKTGRLLAHSHASEIDIGKPVADEIVAANRDQVKGLFHTYTKNGTQAQAILVPVGDFDWSVVIAVPTSTLNEPVRNVTLLLIVFGTAFAILGGMAVALPKYLLSGIPAEPKPLTQLGPSLIALTGSILLGGYTAWLAQGNVQRITESVDTLRQIRSEQRQIEELNYLLQSLEIGQRGFTVTGNDIFMESFETVSQKLPSLAARVKAGFSQADSPEFSWRDFDSLLAQYMQFATKFATTRHTSTISVAQDEALVVSGKLLMDKLRLQIIEMNSRLDKRSNQTEISMAWHRRQTSQQQWLSAFSVSALFLISTAIWLFERQRRVQIHAQLEVTNALLEERVAQRTQDLAAAKKRILLYAQQAQALVDSERKRLSREVHDQVGQIFTGIKLIASSIQSGNLDTAQQAALLDAVESGVKISRRIAAELRPPLLDDFGLPAALEHFLKSCCDPVGISYEVQFPEEHRLSALQMSELFRIVQEACVNVIRHAQAMHLEVVGLITGDSLDVCVDDDGVGFEQALVREGALGILGMHERANLIDAKVHIGSCPMGGTRVNIRLALPPLSDKERA